MSVFVCSLLVQLVLVLCIYCEVSDVQFQHRYYMSLRGFDDKEDGEFQKKFLS